MQKKKVKYSTPHMRFGQRNRFRLRCFAYVYNHLLCEIRDRNLRFAIAIVRTSDKVINFRNPTIRKIYDEWRKGNFKMLNFRNSWRYRQNGKDNQNRNSENREQMLSIG